MGVGDDQHAGGVFLTGRYADDALATAMLGAVDLSRHALDEASATEDHDHPLVGYQVLDIKLGDALGADLGAARIVELVLEFGELFLDDGQNPAGVSQQVLEVGNRLQYLGVLIEYLVAFHARQAAQRHLENGVGLNL